MRILTTIAILLATLSICVAASVKPGKPAKFCRIDPIRIGVVDTGFGYIGRGHDAHLCQYGHKDFSVEQEYSADYGTKTPVPTDLHGHGTNVAGLISEYANKSSARYCLVIIKFFSIKQNGDENARASAAAFRYANNLNLEVVNYSGGGPDIQWDERDAVKAFLNRGGKLIAAAGNEHVYLDGTNNSYYPAMYDSRITVVGNVNNYGNKVESSNFGPYVTTWENGENRIAYGITMTGTSQATAITTGKIIARMGKSCDK